MTFDTLPPHVAAVIRNCIEVTLNAPDDFLKVKETLTRIGIASRKEQKLFQSCHILHKQGRYYIVHFKELFLLDGKMGQTQFDEADIARRNTIANMLSDWGLVTLVDPKKSAAPVSLPGQITVLPFREKGEWQLVAKYEIGKKRV
jgi:Bacteriophage translational regulator